MTKKDLMRYEKRLLAEKMQLLRQRGFIDSILVSPEREKEAVTGGNPSDLGDQGYDTYQRELASRLTSDQTKLLQEIDEALRRIELRSYGICELCGQPIKKARLDVVPHTRYCMKCLRVQEKRPKSAAGRRR